MSIRLPPLIGAAILLLACGDEERTGPSPPPPPPPATLLRLGVDSQAATTGTALDSVIGLRVLDSLGSPVADVAVEVAVTGDGAIGPGPVRSDSAGEVHLTWSVGSTRGKVTATLTAGDLAPLTFTAWALLPPQHGGSVAGGRDHGCRLEPGGLVLCWGLNLHGEVGDGSTLARPAPVAVSTSTTFARVRAGYDDSCALTASGVPWCWGMSFGPTPQPLAGTPGPFVDLVVGAAHRCGLTEDGEAWCSGSNASGQLGDGTTQPRPNVWVLVDTEARFRQLSAGPTYTCGVSRAARIWCWGTHDYVTPLPREVATTERFTAVASGASDTCALAAEGSIWCWGNTWGPPRTIPAGGPVLEQLWGGQRGITWVYCGLAADHGAWCFGYPSSGGLGDGRLSGYPESSPTPVSGGLAFTELGVGERHTCGRTTGGGVACWGDNRELGLGIGPTPWATTPVPVQGAPAFAAITAEDTHACGLTVSGAAWCWGEGKLGALGSGDDEMRAFPTPVSGGPSFASLETAWNRTCGLDTTGAAWCWGENPLGELGDGTTTARTVPTPVAGGHTFIQLSTRGVRHGCGLEADHTLWCWGSNWNGSLGDGTTTQSSQPVQVQSGILFSQVATGNSQTCALDQAGIPYCWGWPEATGQGSYYGPLTPSPVVGGLTFSSIHGSNVTMCGLTAQGEAWCWGRAGAWFGNGDATLDTVFTPVRVAAGVTFSQLYLGQESMCGTSAGQTFCWGNNKSHLGDGTVITRTTPVPVAGGLTFAMLGTSQRLTCGLDGGGAAWCWGENPYGGLGNGTTGVVPRPVAQP